MKLLGAFLVFAVAICTVLYVNRKPADLPVVVGQPTPLPSPTPKPRRLSPPGVFFLTQYISSRTTTGVIGFTPGQRVRVVSQDETVWHMTDGSHPFDIDPALLTNDCDLADALARGDEQAQARVAAASAQESRDLRLAEASRAAGTPPRTIVRERTVYMRSEPTPANPLDRDAKPTNGGRQVSRAPFIYY